MRLVKQTVNRTTAAPATCSSATSEGRPGTIVTCLEYPDLDEGVVGPGSTHHFALAVESEEELRAWHDYLTGRGMPCTEVMDRVYFKSLYLRDPDGHIVELADRTGPRRSPRRSGGRDGARPPRPAPVRRPSAPASHAGGRGVVVGLGRSRSFASAPRPARRAAAR